MWYINPVQTIMSGDKRRLQIEEPVPAEILEVMISAKETTPRLNCQD